jgi:hypothetical protein
MYEKGKKYIGKQSENAIERRANTKSPVRS